jgi:hypothetical protein
MMGSGATVRVAKIIAGAVLALVTAVAAAAPAQAAEVRPGRGWGQVDVLLSSSETRSAATSPWGTSVVCATTVGMVGAIGGYAGVVLSFSNCMGMTAVCAARAYVNRQRAGITYAWNGAWCWRY